MDKKSNTEHLHEEGVLDKSELHEDQIKAIDSLTPQEVETLKSISKKHKKSGDKPVGVLL